MTTPTQATQSPRTLSAPALARWVAEQGLGSRPLCRVVAPWEVVSCLSPFAGDLSQELRAWAQKRMGRSDLAWSWAHSAEWAEKLLKARPELYTEKKSNERLTGFIFHPISAIWLIDLAAVDPDVLAPEVAGPLQHMQQAYPRLCFVCSAEKDCPSTISDRPKPPAEAGETLSYLAEVKTSQGVANEQAGLAQGFASCANDLADLLERLFIHLQLSGQKRRVDKGQPLRV